MKLYFVGIGGIGNSALAQLCAERGDAVSGSNQGETAIWPALEAAGITCFTEHQAEQMDDDTDILIYSEAVPEDNSERVKATKLGISQMSYFQYLGEVAKDYQVIAITGTHGKTTTAGMMAAGLISAHFDATMIVGSKLKEFKGSNFHPGILDPGMKPWLIVEACEYRNNFQYLNPEIVVLTNLELDHVDYYEDEAHYLQTFADFCQKARTVIHHLGDDLVEKALVNFTGDRVKIDVNGFNLPLDLTGQHNRANASLALACAEELSALNIKKFRKGLKHYQGAWRRLELIGSYLETIPVYDDYGHHPTEIKATLQALREKYPDTQIGLIFEPHQYSRTKEFFTEFLESFKSADLVGLYPIYAARDTDADKKSISRKDFVSKNSDIQIINDLESVQSFIETLDEKSVLIFMGAGNISDLAHSFINSQ